MDCGAEFGADLQAGSVVALVGGLGMGKTHFTKGLLRGLDSVEVVTSPTFAILQEYSGGRLPVFHYDLYRLQSADEALRLGWDESLEDGGVVVAEWANRFPELFPEETIWLEIREVETGREVRLYPGEPEDS